MYKKNFYHFLQKVDLPILLLLFFDTALLTRRRDLRELRRDLRLAEDVSHSQDDADSS